MVYVNEDETRSEIFADTFLIIPLKQGEDIIGLIEVITLLLKFIYLVDL